MNSTILFIFSSLFPPEIDNYTCTNHGPHKPAAYYIGQSTGFLPKSLSAPPPPLKNSRRPLDRSHFSPSCGYYLFCIFFLSLWVCPWIPVLGVNCLSAQHVWNFRVSPVRFYFENYTPPKIQIIDYVSNRHPEVQKFKPTALRMAKAWVFLTLIFCLFRKKRTIESDCSFSLLQYPPSRSRLEWVIVASLGFLQSMERAYF